MSDNTHQSAYIIYIYNIFIYLFFQVITENKFTDPNASIRSGTDSPVSIGEALDGSTHHRRNPSNPFQPITEEQTQWDHEKGMLGEQMRLMKEQLESEKAARVQSQVRGSKQ